MTWGLCQIVKKYKNVNVKFGANLAFASCFYYHNVISNCSITSIKKAIVRTHSLIAMEYIVLKFVFLYHLWTEGFEKFPENRYAKYLWKFENHWLGRTSNTSNTFKNQGLKFGILAKIVLPTAMQCSLPNREMVLVTIGYGSVTGSNQVWNVNTIR